MIAISSLRPFDQCTATIWALQLAALGSWRSAFGGVVYLNQPEEHLDGDKIRFVPAEAFPRIRDLLTVAAREPGWSCLINADIQVRPAIFKRIEKDLVAKGAVSAISRRWQFDPENQFRSLSLIDLGLDIFCATQPVWQECLRWVPDQFRIGHGFWDTWMLGFLNVTSRDQWYDFTKSRCILHPLHGDRHRPHEIDTKFRDKFLMNVAFPKKQLV